MSCHVMSCCVLSDLNTDILKAKRANADRVKDFSKQLHEFNKVSLSDQRRLPYSSEAVGVQMTKKKLESSRERANQFAKKIPKPVTVKPKGGSPDGRGEGEEEDEIVCGFGISAGDEKASKLEELQAKHLESKRNIEAMRRSMGM
jgi:Jhy protein